MGARIRFMAIYFELPDLLKLLLRASLVCDKLKSGQCRVPFDEYLLRALSREIGK